MSYSLLLEGVKVAGGSTGAAGSWQRQGPFRVSVGDGKLDLATNTGSLNVSGLEIVPVR